MDFLRERLVSFCWSISSCRNHGLASPPPICSILWVTNGMIHHPACSLIRQIKISKTIAIQTNNSWSWILLSKIATDIEKVIIIKKNALYLVFRDNVFLSSHCFKVGPNQALFSNIWWNLGELFEKSTRATIKNGVVGSIGSIIPINPKSVKSQPKITSRWFCKNFFMPKEPISYFIQICAC